MKTKNKKFKWALWCRLEKRFVAEDGDTDHRLKYACLFTTRKEALEDDLACRYDKPVKVLLTKDGRAYQIMERSAREWMLKMKKL